MSEEALCIEPSLLSLKAERLVLPPSFMGCTTGSFEFICSGTLFLGKVIFAALGPLVGLYTTFQNDGRRAFARNKNIRADYYNDFSLP